MTRLPRDPATAVCLLLALALAGPAAAQQRTRSAVPADAKPEIYLEALGGTTRAIEMAEPRTVEPSRTRAIELTAPGQARPEGVLTIAPDSAWDRPADRPQDVAELSADIALTFALDSARLTSRARRVLDNLAVALRDRTLADARFTVEGHTDSTGSATHNMDLSWRRAEAVVDYLSRRHGIDGRSLQARGYGEDRPLPGLHTADGRNRRVEVVRRIRP